MRRQISIMLIHNGYLLCTYCKEVVDESDGCGGKFSCIIVSDKFAGKPLLQRHRLVNSILQEELKSIHAFSQKTFTPEQWKEESARKQFNVSAPGKVILHGDHSVVYGRLAVAASLGLRTKLKLQETNSDCLEFIFNAIDFKVKFPLEELKSTLLNIHTPLLSNFKSYNFEQPECINQDKIIEQINQILGKNPPLDPVRKISAMAVLYLYSCMLHPSGIPIGPLQIEIESELQVGAGMGSSASFCVVLACGFLEYIKRKYSSNQETITDSFKWISENNSKILNQRELKLINSWAYQAERITHGNPSGIDNTICTYGSIVEFRKETIPKPLQMDHKLMALLIDTKVSRNTKVLVNKVVDLKNRMPIIVENTLNSMEVVSVKAVEYFQKLSELDLKYKKNKDAYVKEFMVYYKSLQEIVDMNQNMLRILGVSHPEIEKILHILQMHNIAGKLTGAGGGGFVLAIIPFYTSKEELEGIKVALTRAGFPIHVLELGGDGVQIH